MEHEGSLSRSQDIPPLVNVLRQINPVHPPSRPICCRSVLMFSSHLNLVRPSVSFPSVFPTQTPKAPLRPLTRATCYANFIIIG